MNEFPEPTFRTARWWRKSTVRPCVRWVRAWLTLLFCGVVAEAQTLTVARVGNGLVTSDPQGIDCGTNCTMAVDVSGPFAFQALINLLAVPDSGWYFQGWSGDADCADGLVWLSADRSCTATFTQQVRYVLSIGREGSGGGSVATSPAAIDCGSLCAVTVPAGTELSLAATPYEGSTFTGWAGDADCSDGRVTMSVARRCVAQFDMPPPESFAIEVRTAGSGSGSVASIPEGISCGSDCSETVLQGTAVELTATPAAGSEFTGWSGSPDCVDGRVEVTEAVTCTASFEVPEPDEFALTVQMSGAGEGSVTSGAGTIACGSVCGDRYAAGSTVELTAAPEAGSRFSGWTGGGCDGTATCLVDMTAGKTVRALFEKPGETTRVSVSTEGAQGGADSSLPDLTADGRVVAFASFATNLVAGDDNGGFDVFVRDRQAARTTRVSVATGGAEGADWSWAPALSAAQGRSVGFASLASNLVAGDTNGRSDVFVHDRESGETTRVSVTTGGAQVSGGSWAPALSADGRIVAFESEASDLVAGDTNSAYDVFVHDRLAHATSRVSVATGGAQATGVSGGVALAANGGIVGFHSDAPNLVPGDTNGKSDVFAHERDSATTTRVSVATGGAQGNGASWAPAVSGDGRYVAFVSEATNLVAGDTNGVDDIFVRDRQAGLTTRVSVTTGGGQGNSDSYDVAISSDGRIVAFSSWASNLVEDDTNATSDVFVHDRHTGQTTRVSTASGGEQGNEASRGPVLSADGGLVAFESAASDLVPGDSNSSRDVFLHDRQASGGECVRSATTACLQDGRFEVKVGWQTATSTGLAEVMTFGGARTENRDSVFFVFFGPTNFEMGLKVLDACVVPWNKYWVFISGLTDQGWTVSVRDTVTGQARTYSNSVGTLSRTFRDQATFGCGTTPVGVTSEGPAEPETGDFRIAASADPGEWDAVSALVGIGAVAGSCSPSATRACLQNGRFEVTVGYRTVSMSGAAEVMSFAGQRSENVDSVFWWFFGPTNFEMGLKVLNACVPALGNKYWVFISGLTDQGWTVTVKDTVTGTVKTYANPIGTLSQTFRDLTSFGCD